MKQTRRHDHAPDRSQRTRHSRAERAVAWVVLFAFFVSPATALADTTTETAIGDATTGDGQFVTNTRTDTTFDQDERNAVIRWDVMDQAADHTLTFRQESGESVLNQASGIRMSVFRGMVKCDAACVFANEAGITFADGSYLDVGRLVAVGGNVDVDAFRAGELHVTGLAGAIENQGTIEAREALLAGARVVNHGEIVLEDGTLTAVVGDEIWLRNHDSNVVVVAPLPMGDEGEAGFAGEAAIENTGDIDAGDGSVRMLAGDMLSYAIRNTGRIRAREIVLEAGEGGLVEVAGDSLLDATGRTPGETGGTIDLLGDYVAVVEHAVLDASGDAGGGRIQVGGARAGEGETRSAKQTYVGRDTTLRADATGDGDGGEIIVWSDGTTASHGTISAQGGFLGGNGGFVETSGRAFLDVTSSPLVSARSGASGDRGGEWLLDPFNIDIVDGTTACGGGPCDLDDQLSEASSYDPDLLFAPTVRADDDSAVSEIDVALLKQALVSGADVTLTTTGSGNDDGNQEGDIRLLTELSFDDADGALPDTDATLTLLAADDIEINDTIRNDATNLSLSLDFRANAEGQRELEAGDGELPSEFRGDLTVNDEVVTGGGSINFTGANVTLDDDVTTGGGGITVRAEGGDATLSAGITLDTDAADPDERGGNVTLGAFARVTEDPLVAGEDLVLGGDVRVEAGSEITTDGGSVSLLGGNRAVASRDDAAGGNVLFEGTIRSGTGSVLLEATRAFNESDNARSQYGGTVDFADGALVETDGANVNLAAFVDAAATSRSDNLTDLRFFGTIRTDASTPGDEVAGGNVSFDSNGFSAGQIEIGDADQAGGPTIETNGGDVTLISGGAIDYVEGTIDARYTGTPDPEADTISGDVVLSSFERISVRAVNDDVEIFADETLVLIAGTDGVANLSIDTSGVEVGNVTLGADSIDLRAGDGLGGQNTARVDLSRADDGFTLQNRAGDGNPDDLAIVQDASLETGDLPLGADHFFTGSFAVDNLIVRSSDGALDFGGLDATAVERMTLSAREDLLATTPVTLSADILGLEVYDGFTVDSDLADAIDASDARVVEITAGALGDLVNTTEDESADLVIADDIGETGITEELFLRSGAGGRGDLRFTGTPTLRAEDITLWAGDGSTASNSAEVVAIEDGTAMVAFDFGAAAAPRFTLRQSAAIENEDIPDASQFSGGVDGVDYTLRSDGGGIGGEDAIQTSKLEDTYLSLHARDAIDAIFATGMTDATLRVRGLDIGGTQSFSYDRSHNDAFELNDGGADTTLTIRAGLSGQGVLSFDGTPEDGDTSDFEIVANEIRLVAGDGLSGGIEASIFLDRDADNKPVFKGPGDTAVERFVFRQDAPIQNNDIAPTDLFFDDVAPEIHVVHSDYDPAADPNSNIAAISLLAADTVPTAANKLILSGESVQFVAGDEEDLVLYDVFSDFDEDVDPGPDPLTPLEIEIRTDRLDVRANDTNNLAAPIEFVLDDGVDPVTVTITDFERFESEDEADALTPTPFDIDATPTTVPNQISIFMESDITAAFLTSLRGALGNADVTVHDGDPDDPDDSALTLFLESVEGDIFLESAPVDGTDLRLTVNADGAQVNWDRTAAYALESLIIGSDHSFVFGAGVDTAPALDLTIEDAFQISAGAGGSDGNISFEPNVTISANQVALRAGVVGSLTEGGESAAVDLATNSPTFLLLSSGDPGDPSDTIFEVIQDAGFTDDDTLVGDDFTRIIAPTQFDPGSDAIGEIKLVSEAGSIEVRNLSTTFQGSEGGGEIDRLEFEAGTVDLLDGGTILIADEAGGDTDLTLYDSVDLEAREIILLADGSDTVITDDPDVLFRTAESSLGDALRFRIEHESADVRDCATGCGTGKIAGLDQFVTTGTDEPVDYALVSRLGGIEITSEMAAKLRGGTNANPDLVALTLSAASDSEILISAQQAGRAVDLQLASLVVGAIGDESQIRFSDDGSSPLVVSTTGDQIYYGDVEIEGEVALTGDFLDFNGDISSSDEAALSLNVRDEVAFGGDVDLVRDTGGPDSVLRVNLDPGQSDIARVSFDADGEGQTVSADRVEFFGTRERDLDEGEGFFPGNARRSKTATIGKRSGDLRFDVTSLRMAEGEKMSVGGALTIGDANTTLAALGDLSALSIDVVADTIVLLLRKAGEYIGADGKTRKDGGVDYVANTIALDGEIELAGDGRAPAFGVEDAFGEQPDLEGFLIAEIESGGGRLRASDFDQEFQGGVPDFHPEGATRDDYTNIYDTRLTDPSVVTAFATHLGDAKLTTQDALLSRIDIALEADRAEAKRSRVEGAGIIDDVGGDLPTRADRRVKVSTSRILARDAREVAERHRRLFGDGDGRAQEVRQTLQGALDDYLAETGARRVLGFEFRRYLRNRPSSQFDAYLVLEDLDALFSYHRNLGLTPGEYSRIQLRWLATIKPEGISLEQFAEAVHPSRFVRGSDILDVFGD